MGVIYYKNKQYASGGSTPSSSSEHIELTYAEYQALSEAEQKNGAVYFITDVDNDGGITGYTGGTGITISEDKIISIKDIKKNYIDNSNFRINTRGQSEYVASDTTTYTVDRWYIDGGILTPVENGVQFTNPNTEAGSSSLVRLKQNIGYSFADFAGKTITLSAKINDVVYSGTATISTEKPTEGTATQYIAVGIADFGINLNYSITGDYFVPYFALAYNRTILIEWMKLEVNSEFSGYIEPDYTTELIKMNMTTSDKGVLNLPYTKEEVDDLIPTTMTAASASAAGTGGLVPAPEKIKSEQRAFLTSKGTWEQSIYLIEEPQTLASGSSTVIAPSAYLLELWIFTGSGPNSKRVYLVTNTASGAYWVELGYLGATTTSEQSYNKITLIQGNGSTPYSVTVKVEENADNLSSYLYRYALYCQSL